MRCSLVLTLTLAATPLFAQQAARTVSPGMTRAQVIAALGEPVTLREASGYTFIFYRNECAKKCGINDLVVLEKDSVVDAIFRSPRRRYTGESSSPAPIPAREAAKIGRSSRMKPAPANDVKPSIPVQSLIVRPAPAP